MKTCQHISKHLREIYFGDNWTCVNVQEELKNVTWQQAKLSHRSLNSIATLLHHMTYYVRTITPVLEGGALVGKDVKSFEYPPLESQEDWIQMQNNAWADVKKLSNLIEQLDESILNQTFREEKYGSYYRNLHGLIEHCHYHLGQIVLIKKMINK